MEVGQISSVLSGRCFSCIQSPGLKAWAIFLQSLRDKIPTIVVKTATIIFKLHTSLSSLNQWIGKPLYFPIL